MCFGILENRSFARGMPSFPAPNAFGNKRYTHKDFKGLFYFRIWFFFDERKSCEPKALNGKAIDDDMHLSIFMFVQQSRALKKR